jgi:hypothetical protein
VKNTQNNRLMAAKIPLLEGWAAKLGPVSPGLAAYFHETADWIRRSLEHGTGFDGFGAGRTEKKTDTMIEIADILMKEWDAQNA